MLYGLFFGLIFVFYFAPMPFRFVVMPILLGAFAISKHNYWWLALYFIIATGAWGLFTEGTRAATTGMPLISFGSGLSFTFKQLFVFVAFGKAIYLRRPFRSLFASPFLVIFIYFALLLLISISIGTPFGLIIDDLKHAIGWTLVFIFPALIVSREAVYRFIYLVLPIVILVFIDGMYFLFTEGHYIYELFNVFAKYESSQILRFKLPGWHALLLGFIVSLALAQVERRYAFFLYTMAGMAFFAQLISGTRSWFVIFSIIAAYTLWRGEKMRPIVVVGGFVMLIVLYIVPMTNSSMSVFKGATERVFTVFEINQAGSDSNQQIEDKMSQRLPQQLKYISENPITGWGFTTKRGDMDVGVFGQIVEMGIVGLVLFVWLWRRYLQTTRSIFRNKQIQLSYRNLIAVFWIGFVGLLISHFTTNQIFGITYYILFIAVYFWVTDFFLREALNNKTIEK